jgi:ABC-type sugar transport system permease subunit
MENFFGILAVVVVLAAFPGGYWLARCCAKNIAGRVLLTLLFGIVFMIVGVIAVVSGCSAAGGKMDFK